MLISTEHKILPAAKKLICLKIKTILSFIHAYKYENANTYWHLNIYEHDNCWHFNIYEHDKCHAQLS